MLQHSIASLKPSAKSSTLGGSRSKTSVTRWPDQSASVSRGIDSPNFGGRSKELGDCIRERQPEQHFAKRFPKKHIVTGGNAVCRRVSASPKGQICSETISCFHGMCCAICRRSLLQDCTSAPQAIKSPSYRFCFVLTTFTFLRTSNSTECVRGRSLMSSVQHFEI